MSSNNYEKLGVFYLGKKYDISNKKTSNDELILYDSKDLTTHAVCVGMTGSGKTGLGIVVLEEAIIDGIPAIIIDPKGDMGNMLLTFPDMIGENFEPWVNPADASDKGSTKEYAKQESEKWKKGLAEWNQDGTRIKRLRESADFVIYTPGSNSGIPVSILKSFEVPPKEIMQDNEALREKISSTVTSLLSLVGIDANPIESREHILISSIIEYSWKDGKNLDIPSIIQLIQSPPVIKIGVLDTETFFPAKERFSLITSLNNLLASSGFSSWMEGDSLDIQNLLYGTKGKSKVSIFSISHLNDKERMFFVSLLLNQLLGWLRSQSGTTSLRAILYMDEIFGYFPPVANPPSKTPLLTLLKQARAFGLGIILATQNPVDLDYKGLSNTGTWFIGRLQTEKDKERVLDGLEGASQTLGKSFERKEIDKILSALDKRIFVMSNAHEDGLEIFQTRMALSYLRGPLIRDQIKVLMDPLRKNHESLEPQPETVSSVSSSDRTNLQEKTNAKLLKTDISGNADVNQPGQRPTIPPNISQYFIPIKNNVTNIENIVYHPYILGGASLTFSDKQEGLDLVKDVIFVTPVTDDVVPVDWQNAQEIGLKFSEISKDPATENSLFVHPPSVINKTEKYDDWKKDFIVWLTQNNKLTLYKDPLTQSLSRAGESEKDFRLRISQKVRENRDESAEKLRKKYAPRLATIQEKINRAKQKMNQENDQVKQQNVQTAISIGTSLLGAFMGRRTSSLARGIGRSMKERKDVQYAKESLESLNQQLLNVQSEFDSEVASLNTKTNQQDALETVLFKPNKNDISVKLLSLVWYPSGQDSFSK
ncbi:MAG: helicase HerA domain-containing protein [Nitrososphaerota archaeon]